MNAHSLLQQTTLSWLTEPDWAALGLREAQLVITAVNAAQAQVWGWLPAHYTTQALSYSFGTPYFTVPGATMSLSAGNSYFTGTIGGQRLAHFCTIIIEGDATPNEIVATNLLLHPYRGTSSGLKTFTITQDALRLAYRIKQFTRPFRCIETMSDWTWTPWTSRHGWGDSDSWSVQRVWGERTNLHIGQGSGVEYSVLRINNRHSRPLLFETAAVLEPTEFSISDAISGTPRTLLYQDSVARWIIQLSGQHLRRHPKFQEKALQEASYAGADVLAAIKDETVQATPIGGNYIGPPTGW